MAIAKIAWYELAVISKSTSASELDLDDSGDYVELTRISWRLAIPWILCWLLTSLLEWFYFILIWEDEIIN